jgi:hypothetical protein
MTIEEKAKTLMQDLKTIFKVSGLGTRNLLFKDVFEYCRNASKDAQQEIDKLKTFRDNAYKKWCDSQAEVEHLKELLLKYNTEAIEYEQKVERERGLQKQKLQPFYDTLVAMVPKTVKIEEYDKETKESWIVQTADPSEWSMFIDSLDGWLVKFKEMLK